MGLWSKLGGPAADPGFGSRDGRRRYGDHGVFVMKIEPATMAHVAGIRALYDAMAGEDAVAFPRVDDHAFYMMDDLRCSNPQFVAVAPTAIQIDDGGLLGTTSSVGRLPGGIRLVDQWRSLASPLPHHGVVRAWARRCSMP